jgi:hypothetical protein
MHGPIGAAVGALAAADTGLFLDHHPAVLLFIDRLHGAEVGTLGILALEAHDGNEIQVELSSQLPGRNGLHPAPPRLGFESKIVFLPAGNLAGIAPYTRI